MKKKAEESAVLETLPLPEQGVVEEEVASQDDRSEGVCSANTLTEKQVQERDKVCSINTVAKQPAEV